MRQQVPTRTYTNTQTTHARTHTQAHMCARPHEQGCAIMPNNNTT